MVDVVEVTPKIKVTWNPLKIMKIKSKKEYNASKEISQTFNVTNVINTDTLLQDAWVESKIVRLNLVRHTKEIQIMKKGYSL